jgi:hypothetical protein
MKTLSTILFLFPSLIFAQSIQFQHNYNVFGIEENDTDTFQIRLSSLPSGDVTVTLSASNDGGLLSFSPSELTFTTGNYNSYQDVYITADSTLTIDAVRSATVTATASGGGYNGVDLDQTCYLRERQGDVVVWMIGDPHLGTDLANPAGNGGPFNGVDTAINNFCCGQSGGERLLWDIGICVGDITGIYFEYITGELSDETDGPYSGKGAGYVWRETWNDSGIDIHNIYTVAGNHDGGDTLQQVESNQYIDLYIDPWGDNTDFSGIDNNSRPYPVTKHRKDIGEFSIGSIKFVLIHDRNDAKYPAGKSTVNNGHPAGTYTVQAINIFDSILVNSPQQTIFGVAHHLLEGTAAYSGFGEEQTAVINNGNGLHGNHGPLDSLRGSYAAIVWDESMDFDDPDAYKTYDGVNLDGDPITPPEIGFKQSLNKQIDKHYWMAGHTHPWVTAFDTYNGRQMVYEKEKNYTVVNCGALTEYHGQTEHQYSRVLHFYEGEKKFRMQTYTHIGKTFNLTEYGDDSQAGRVVNTGFEDTLEKILTLNVCFDSNFDPSSQSVRGNCPTCNE